MTVQVTDLPLAAKAGKTRHDLLYKAWTEGGVVHKVIQEERSGFLEMRLSVIVGGGGSYERVSNSE